MLGKRLAIKGFLIIFLILSVSIVSGAQDFIALDEIVVGMTGYGRTVFRGTQVESFPVEVKGILQQGFNRNLILIKTSGAAIEKIGGVASGMSGSPVYFEDKLAGAIAYGWSLSDHRYALVTPIKEMLNIWTYTESAVPSFFDELPWIEPLLTPLIVSGFGSRALEHINQELSHYNVEIMQGLASSRGTSQEVDLLLEGGSAVAIELMRGDMGMAFIGTVTLVEEDKFLAFGHPLFNIGAIDFFVSHAYIHEIIPSLSFPFKLGQPLELVGKATQDRGGGVGGQLNEFSSLIPLKITVLDQDTSTKNIANVQIVKDERLTPSLVTTAALQLLDETLDRIGMGTATMKMDISAAGLAEKGLIRENNFFSGQDIASRSLNELVGLLSFLVTNPFREMGIFGIELSFEIEERNSLAYIQDIKVAEGPFYPGDTIEIQVAIRPYRGEVFIKNIDFELPLDIPLGGASLIVSGGTTFQPHYAEFNNNGSIDYYYKSFDAFLEAFATQPKNSDLIVEIHPYQMAAVDEEGLAAEKRIKDVYSTKYILEGLRTREIVVEEITAADDEDITATNAEK